MLELLLGLTSTAVSMALLASVYGAVGLATGGLIALARQRQLPAQRAPTRVVLAWAAAGGLTLGALGFLIGFFGPLLLAPQANQGPLLGIFITGPAGAAVGGLAGLAAPRPRP